MIGEQLGLSKTEMIIGKEDTEASSLPDNKVEAPKLKEIEKKQYEIWLIDKYSSTGSGKEAMLESENFADTSFRRFRTPEHALAEMASNPDNPPIAIFLGLEATDFAKRLNELGLKQKPKLIANSPNYAENNQMVKDGLVDFRLDHRDARADNYRRIIQDIIG